MADTGIIAPPLPPGLMSGLQGFNKNGLKSTETHVTHQTTVTGAGKSDGIAQGPDTAIKGDDIQEFFDEPGVLREKARALADILREPNAKMIVFTGAGISTAAKIPDYRGPNGIWTRAAQGRRMPKMKLESALPTYTHMCLKKLVDVGLCTMVVSTNVDGLHRRSGLLPDNLAELHGNVYKEKCRRCRHEYLRPTNVTSTARSRFTGRLCEQDGCQGRLVDSIINFGQNLPQYEVNKAENASREGSVALVLGTSMRVAPACTMPRLVYKGLLGQKKGHMALLNLQKTPFDKEADIRIYGKCDEWMIMLMEELEMAPDEFNETAYIEEIQRAEETIIDDPTFDSIPVRDYEVLAGAMKPCGPNIHNELLNRVRKAE